MDQLPLFHRIAGQPVLVLGEGDAADAKARLVEEAGGTVVTELGPGVRLAFVALAEGAEEAASRLREAGLLVNVVDRPDLCDFTVPAIIDRSPVVVAVGTGGASASLSKALKERLDLLLPSALGAMARAIRDARAPVAATHADVPARRAFWSALLAPGAALDPFGPAPDPAAAIIDALAGDGEPRDSVDEIRVGPEGADALTLRELRLLASADLVVHAPGMPLPVLALIRRDAARHTGETMPEGATGRIVILKLDEG
ncbi:precorrin-2 dehydrogenase/sirohydrochlorin ferrochelatase family protein [Sandaracinobacteroides sp. A072]|uniref:precorrin-2 dehydrogenase/sirohydrochlorin ferrochelatase family protein n=1 Tax=Sandaracinobacteroides sp. A072 TaxID=3461146 RepID=UPI0040413FF9